MTRYDILCGKSVPYHIIVKEWRHDFYSKLAHPLYKISIDYAKDDSYTFFDISWHYDPSDRGAVLNGSI